MYFCMQSLQLLIIPNEQVFLKIKEIYSLSEKDNFWEYHDFSSESRLYIFSSINDVKIFLETRGNWAIEKILYLDIAKNLIDSEMLPWDVIIPHTYISKWKNPIFLENTLWEEYNLEKFILYLSWVCSSWEDSTKESDDFLWDIEQTDAYNLMMYLKDKGLLELTTWAFWVSLEDEHTNFLSAVADLIIRD